MTQAATKIQKVYRGNLLKFYTQNRAQSEDQEEGLDDTEN